MFEEYNFFILYVCIWRARARAHTDTRIVLNKLNIAFIKMFQKKYISNDI